MPFGGLHTREDIDRTKGVCQHGKTRCTHAECSMLHWGLRPSVTLSTRVLYLQCRHTPGTDGSWRRWSAHNEHDAHANTCNSAVGALLQELDPGAAAVGSVSSDHSEQPLVAGTNTKLLHNGLVSHFSAHDLWSRTALGGLPPVPVGLPEARPEPR